MCTIGVGAGKFFGVQRIFAQISPNLPEKLQKNNLQKKTIKTTATKKTTAFDALLRNNLYRSFIRCASSSNFFSRSYVWCFLQTFIFPQLIKAPVWWRPTAVIVGMVHCFGVRVLSVLLLCNKKKKCVCNVYKPSIQKVRSAVKMLYSPQCWLVMYKHRLCKALPYD